MKNRKACRIVIKSTQYEHLKPFSSKQINQNARVEGKYNSDFFAVLGLCDFPAVVRIYGEIEFKIVWH